MVSTLFCPTCGSTVAQYDTSCKCGYSIGASEKSTINSKVQKINSLVFINDNPKELATQVLSNLDVYKLSKIYYIGSSAKDDYHKKASFIKNELIPAINNWKDVVQFAEHQLAKDKVEVFGKIIGITDFVLKEFYGPFSVKENGLLEFAEYRDFSRYELSETMINADLDFSDFETVNFGTIGTSVISSIEDTLKNGSFKELADKNEWSQSDLNQVKGELGIAVAGELISGLTNLIGQNSKAIKGVRQADSELNIKIKTISTVVSSLKIEQNELIKHKRLFDKSDLILDTCFEKILKPIVDELNKNQEYLEYKKNREPYDLQQLKINIQENALKEHTRVAFWGCLLNSKKRNFNKHLEERLVTQQKLNNYKNLNNKLNEENHKSLLDSKQYKDEVTKKFMDYERKSRPVLKQIPAIRNNAATVKSFIQVLRNVKNNVTPK